MTSVLYGLNMVPQYRMIYNHRDFALWFDCDWDIFSWTCLLEAPVISSHLASDFWMEQRVSWLVFNESKGHGPWLWFNLKWYHCSNLPCGFQVQTWGGTFWHMNYMKCRVLQAGSESENMVIPRMKPQGLTTPVGTWGLRRWFQLTWVTWTFQPSSSEYLQTWFQMATMNSLPSGQRSGRFWTVVEPQNHPSPWFGTSCFTFLVAKHVVFWCDFWQKQLRGIAGIAAGWLLFPAWQVLCWNYSGCDWGRSWVPNQSISPSNHLYGNVR